jgi:AcrR family transcriptional regulator
LYLIRIVTSSPDPAPLPPLPIPHRRRRPTRRTAHTREAIVAAAIDVLDEAGTSGISMRRVAERLGTGAASLYAHVSGKEELLELVFDELAGQVRLPTPDRLRWREQIHEIFSDWRAILVAHRDVALVGLAWIPTTPNMLQASETVVAILRAGGLTDRIVSLAADQLAMYVAADAFEEGLLEVRGLSPDGAARYYEDAHDFYRALPADLYPTLAALTDDIIRPDGEERFSFGLDALIAGFEALTARERAG